METHDGGFPIGESGYPTNQKDLFGRIFSYQENLIDI